MQNYDLSNLSTHIGKIYKRKETGGEKEENGPNTPLMYRVYDSAAAACEFLIDYCTSLKLYICYICVPEGNTASPLMMIKIENIFYLIKIHLANNHSAPNFSRDCQKLNKAQSLQTLSSWEQRHQQAVQRTFFPLDLFFWESYVKGQLLLSQEKMQGAKVYPPPTFSKRTGPWIRGNEDIPGWCRAQPRKRLNVPFTTGHPKSPNTMPKQSCSTHYHAPLPLPLLSDQVETFRIA